MHPVATATKHQKCAGLEGFSLNVPWNKAERLNNMAVQHCHQTMMRKYWKLWRDHLEETEDQSVPLLTERAMTNYRVILLRSCFHHWREKLGERTRMQELEHRADIWFKGHMLTLCFNSWVKFTMQRRLHEERRHKAEEYNRRNRKQEAHRLGDLHCMRLAMKKWKKFVQGRREKKRRLKEVQRYHEVKLLKHFFVAWKKCHLQMSQVYEDVEERFRRQRQDFLRNVLTVWRERATLMAEVRLAEQQAQNHFRHVLQLKVFLAWKEATAHTVSQRHQQGEALMQAQSSINQVRLLQYFRQWREQTREARREEMSMEKAKRHYNSKLLSETLKAWSKYHYQKQKNKVMKRQGILLLRLKMYQVYFEQWKMKLQHRQRETKQTERALWHWSLTLQAKVLYGWRMWVIEQRDKQEQAARAAKVYRDQLLMEGVTCILTYATHMSDLTTSLTEFSQPQTSQSLQNVVKRCAMRWKQRALCRSRKGQAKPSKKSVTFCLTPPAVNNFSSSDSVDHEDEGGALRTHPQKESGLGSTRAALHPFEFSHPSRTQHPAVPSCLRSAKHPDTSSHQSPLISTVLPSLPTQDSLLEAHSQDLLLPPSAFMIPGNQDKLRDSCPGRGPLMPFHQPDAPFKHQPSAYPETHLKTSSIRTEDPHEENASADPISALTRELLDIQLDMKSFRNGRKQLRAWQKLREVFQSWLKMSGEDEEMEREAVWEELKELEERICRLSTELERRKPTIHLHAERIQRLRNVFASSKSGKHGKQEL